MEQLPLVLFVDDEPSILEGIVRGLRKAKFEIITTPSGEAALALMEQRGVDVIVTDYRMPGINGSQLLTMCREKWPETIRIMLTGGASLDAALNATFGGWVYQYLEKPVKIDELHNVIESALLSRATSVVTQFAHLLISEEAHSVMVQKWRITSSPDRPTFAADRSILEWAETICATDQLPPELDRIRPVVEALSEINGIAMEIGGEKTTEEMVQQIRKILAEIT